MKQLHVLIIEDDEMNRQLMARYISKLGHTSDDAINGQEGIAKLAENNYHIIVMDLEMPVQNGYETAVIIRQLEDHVKKHTPILAFTGQAYPALQQKAIEAGVDDFVMKPIDFSDLKQKLHLYTGFEDNKASNIPSKKEDTLKIKETPYKVVLQELTSYPFKQIKLNYLTSSAQGDATFVKRMISSFVSKTPEYLSDLQSLVQNKQYAELKTLAHKYKATIVITEVSNVALLIEELEFKIIENRELETLPTMVKSICDQSKIAVEEAVFALKTLQGIPD